MAMTRKKVLILVGAMVLIAAIAGLRFPGRTPGYAPELVDPNLTALQEPFQRVLSSYELRGNTIGIEIVDAFDQRAQFALPGRAKNLASYPRVMVGEHWRGEQREVEHPEDTKHMLIEILAKYPSPMNDECVGLLRRDLVAATRALWWRWKWKLL
jgi:hypothetical protein